MGSLNGNNKNLFLLDSDGNRILGTRHNQPIYWLDFGNSSFHKYSVEATVTDHLNQPWSADGVFSDCMLLKIANTTAVPAKYNTRRKMGSRDEEPNTCVVIGNAYQRAKICRKFWAYL